MIKKYFLLIKIIAVFCSAPLLLAQDTLRLMPLGDSITRGSGDSLYNAGFRRVLFFALKNQGYKLNFVGSYNQGDTSGGFDADHESDSGLHAEYFIPLIDGLLSDNPAQFITFHIGTNDIEDGDSPDTIVAKIGRVLTTIDQWEASNNKVTVFLAQIVNRSNTTDVAIRNNTTLLNQKILTMANNRIANGDRIVVVNLETDASINYAIDSSYPYNDGDMYDSYHPNFSGHSKMGNKFFSAIQNYLAPSLSLPANNQTNVAMSTTLKWFKKDEVGVSNYRVQVATSPTFTDPTIIINDSTITDTTKLVSNLKSLTKYYWRVRTKFRGGWSDYSSVWSFTTTPLYVKAKVFLQGAFNTTKGSMDSTLNALNYIPHTQPYNTSPWNYAGSDSVTSIPSNNIVDWVLLELRTSTSSSSMVSQRAALLKSDGTIVDTNNTNQVAFSGLSFGNFYIVVNHRNHLSIMSKNLISLSDTSALYNFTDSLSHAYGTNPMADLGGGKFGMFAGNNDGNNSVSTNDYNAVANNLFQMGYKIADHNMSGTISVTDYNSVANNLFKVSQVP